MVEGPEITCSCEVPLTFGDLDPMGIVWHGNYVKFLEHGREAFGHAHGLDGMDLFCLGWYTPIVHTRIDHKAMLEYGDTVIVETRFVPNPAAKIVLRYTLRSKNTGAVVAEAETIQVFLDHDKKLVLLPPPPFTEWKSRHGLN